MIERVKEIILPLIEGNFIEVRVLHEDEESAELLVMVESSQFHKVLGHNGGIIKSISNVVDFSGKHIKIKLEAF